MSSEPKHFIQTIIEEDLANKKHDSMVTRFPQSQMAICILAMPSPYA